MIGLFHKQICRQNLDYFVQNPRWRWAPFWQSV